MGFFRELSESKLPEETSGTDQEKATANEGDKEEKKMSDFEDANVDKDILSQILGDNASEDSGDDLFADSAADDSASEGQDSEEVVQTKIPDMVVTEEEDKELSVDDIIKAASEEGDKEEELSVDDILKTAAQEEQPKAEKASEWQAARLEDVPDADVTVITKGTTINGGISSDGSLEIMGTITGDVECLGKVSVYGTISGNVAASDVMIQTKRLEGNIKSDGSVEVATGTIVLGDVTGTSATVAGAVKGNIDVNGPVVVDSTAIVKGSIKAKSIQVNTGAVVDGYCSLNYAGVNLEEFFDEK